MCVNVGREMEISINNIGMCGVVHHSVPAQSHEKTADADSICCWPHLSVCFQIKYSKNNLYVCPKIRSGIKNLVLHCDSK